MYDTAKLTRAQVDIFEDSNDGNLVVETQAILGSD